MKRALLVAVTAVVLLVGGGGVAYYLHVQQQARDVKGSSTVEFVPTETVATKPKEPGVAWPTYGHDAQRLRFANGISLAPPFRRVWTFHARSLVEFPPVVAYGRLFFANNAGVMFGVGAANGRKAWSYVSHRCLAASPAVDRHVVFQTFLNAPPCNRKPSVALTGEVIAFGVGDGSIRWRKVIGPSESSPLVVGASVYVGDWNGRVWALRRRTGKVRWVTKLAGQVKGGVAVSGDRLFVGDYSSHVYALNAQSGRVLWQAKAQPRLGHAGNFYGTPAVAYGRVYIGGTDGKVYSFGAASGKLRWSQSTGGYVYSSPAVWRDRVYAGSYSHRFFCFDAATGAILWQFTANGPISGSPTIIAGRVYFATLKGTTYALDARSGHQVWSFPDGQYSPVVADAERLYLVGSAKLYGLVEQRATTTRAHRLNEAGALRVLRRGGLRRLQVVGVHPLAIHVGRPGGTASEHVCHLAIRGKRANVRRAGILLARACG